MAGDAVAMWPEVFHACGIGLEVLRVGCCGMAGTFGHETRHRGLSTRIYDMSWRDRVRELAGSGRLLASGFSCRCQAKRLDGATLRHPAQILRELVRDPGFAGRRAGTSTSGVSSPHGMRVPSARPLRSH